MQPEEFSRFCKEGIAAGQRRFADAARAFLARADATNDPSQAAACSGSMRFN